MGGARRLHAILAIAYQFFYTPPASGRFPRSRNNQRATDVTDTGRDRAENVIDPHRRM
jgi:hypothetical protein